MDSGRIFIGMIVNSRKSFKILQLTLSTNLFNRGRIFTGMTLNSNKPFKIF